MKGRIYIKRRNRSTKGVPFPDLGQCVWVTDGITTKGMCWVIWQYSFCLLHRTFCSKILCPSWLASVVWLCGSFKDFSCKYRCHVSKGREEWNKIFLGWSQFCKATTLAEQWQSTTFHLGILSRVWISFFQIGWGKNALLWLLTEKYME